MYCSFISQANINTTIQSTNVYTLHIDMGKGLNIYQFRSTKNPSFILPVRVTTNETNTTLAPYTSFYLEDMEQRLTQYQIYLI